MESMHARHISLALALAAALLPSGAAAAGSAASVLPISVEVTPSGVFRFETRRPLIEVSEADLERGYIEIAAGSLLHVQAGRLTPIVVADFMPEAGPFKSVEMRTDTGWLAAGADASRLRKLDLSLLDALPPSGAVRPQDPAAALAPALSTAAPTPPAVSAAVSYRFNLAEEAAPGVYPLPLTLNINL